MLLTSIMLHAAAASAFLVPILMFINAVYTRNIRVTIQYYIFSLYLCIVYDLVGPPNITYMNWDPAVNWIPLIGMMEDIRSNVLNVLLFVPLGAGLPFIWKKYRAFSKTVFFGFALSLVIEMSQLFTLRATDVNDLITNTLGAMIGYLLSKHIFSNNEEDALINPIILTAVSCAVMFFGEPFVFNRLYSLI